MDIIFIIQVNNSGSLNGRIDAQIVLGLGTCILSKRDLGGPMQSLHENKNPHSGLLYVCMPKSIIKPEVKFCMVWNCQTDEESYPNPIQGSNLFAKLVVPTISPSKLTLYVLYPLSLAILHGEKKYQ